MDFTKEVKFLGLEEYTNKTSGKVSYSMNVLSNSRVYRVGLTDEQYKDCSYKEGQSIEITLVLKTYNNNLYLVLA